MQECHSCGHAEPEGNVDGSPYSLEEVVRQLGTLNNGLARPQSANGERHLLPSGEVLEECIDLLRSVLFPGYFGPSELNHGDVQFHLGATLIQVQRLLQEQVRRGLCFVCNQESPDCPECHLRAKDISQQLISRLPEIRRMLSGDVQAAYEGDPAATGPDEAILCYPGITAITNYRLAHELYGLGVPLLPRMIMEQAHAATGVDIHPGASIGEQFFMDHGTGVVIGETCVIGNNVRIYQGVTLGAKSFPLDEDGKPAKGMLRHPIVEDDVTIYSGATILGRITIGRGSVIGGNVWLTRSVSPGTTVTQAAGRHEQFIHGAGI